MRVSRVVETQRCSVVALGRRVSSEHHRSGHRKSPWGNRTNNEIGQRPHYHLAIPDPNNPGYSLPNQRVSQHRPYESGGWGLGTWLRSKF